MTNVDRILVMLWATVGYGYSLAEWIDSAGEAWGVDPFAFVVHAGLIATAPLVLAIWWYRTIKDVRA